MITWTNETRKLRDLIPWERNPREINKREAERLGDSLEEFGQIQTIAIGPDNEILDGHQRKAVWSLLPQFGPDHEVDVRIASRTLTDRERQKLVVFLHRGTMGAWDWDELANSFEVPDLLEWGFEESELQLDWGDDATPDPGAQVDKAAELQEKWRVARGQVWQVGHHRVMCGDSTSEEDVGRLVREQADLLVTSPPYGVGKDYESHDIEDWIKTIRGTFGVMSAKSPLWFVNLANRRTGNDGWERHTFGAMLSEFEEMGFRLIGLRVWVKPPCWLQHPYWRHTYKPVDDFEFIGLFAKEKPKHKNRLSSDDNTDWGYRGCWTVGSVLTNDIHAAMYPPEIPTRGMLMLSDEGAVVIDPFLGSGTTLVACEQTNRIGYGMEIEPKYVAVTLERLAGMGLEPALVK